MRGRREDTGKEQMKIRWTERTTEDRKKETRRRKE